MRERLSIFVQEIEELKQPMKKEKKSFLTG